MRRRPSPILSVGTAVLVGLLSAGCADDETPADGPTSEPTPSSSESETPTTEPTETPVAGAGAQIDPKDATAWCGAVTPEQLAGLTTYEVAGIDAAGTDVQTCTADLPDSELLITWGSEPTKKSFEQYAASFDRPVGVYAPSTITLDGGQPAVVAPRPASPTAYAGTVVDGQLFQVVVSGVTVLDADSDDLGEMARQVLAVYVD